jgi:asparagine synthase (glutamine-hydrolysing)
MSGICGLCEAGAQLLPFELEPMLRGLVLAGERPASAFSARGALFGISPRWDFQAVGSRNGILAAVSADLWNVSALLADIRGRSNWSGNSVAELIAEMYGLYGLGFLDKLEGSFSVALWDANRQELVLAVDHLGLETLYWAQDGSRVLFGSRLGAVAEASRECDINPAALVQFLLYTVVPAPLTIYRNIRRLEPGTVLLWKRAGEITTKRYWDLSYEESAGGNTASWAEQLRSHIRQAVHSHLHDCLPEQTGAYLSGGTDSSSVLAFASELHAPVNTFSIYFENPRYDEIGFARTAAERFHANHHEKCLTARDAVEAIPAIADYFDEPFANSSAIGAYHCARLARENGVETLLAGDGGDELFAGNERYASDKKFALYHSLPATLRRGLLEPLARLLPGEGMLSLPARYMRRAELPNPYRMFSYSFFLSQVAGEIFDPDLLSQVPVSTWLDIPSAHFHAAPQATSELNRLLYLDVKMTLADNDVRKVRGTAEIAGVKVRFPLMDHRLAEFSGQVPSRLKLRGFEKRFIFKEAMKGILPATILYKKKHGFGVPVGYWVLHDPEMKSLAEALDEPQTRQRGYFRPDFLSRIKRLNETYPAYYGEVVWVVLMLELWHRRHLTPLPANGLELGAAHAP